MRKSFLHDYVQINRRNILEHTIIGQSIYTGFNTILKHVIIGRYCSISWNVSATGNTHDNKKISAHPFTQLKSCGFVDQIVPLENETITLGNDVWIGSNVCILAGVTIGDGAIIGARSVITKDVPPYAIIAGHPVEIKKFRFNEAVVQLLLESKWWNLPREILKKNI